ncbi:MAG TPA: DNA gyrase C-terminal beta-propeller domain-containing protein, partial [Dehalococcoidia bacterium]|nr:DNA gyrase C-terminal beta-propeller domain-containing protein [Dehalococcoidia bacterium]
MRKETHELKRKYGDERRTEVHPEELGDWRREDTEPHEDVVITLSRNGYVKRVKLDTYKKQHRGGKGVRGQRMTTEDDVTPHLQIADTHDYLLFFTDQGRVFASRVFELPADQSRNTRGTPIQNLGFNMEPREEVQAVVAVASYLEDTYLVMATKKGQVKRMHLPLLRNMNRSGLRCFNLKGDDGLIGAVLADEDEDVILVSKEGMSIRFKSSEVRARQRAAGGMKGMTVQNKDAIVSMNVVDDEGYLLIVSQKGYGKLSLLRHYTQQRRGGKGLITLKVTTKTGKVADSAVVSEEIRTDSTGKLVLVSEKAQVIRTNLGEIRSTGRIAQGVKIQVPESGDKISAIRVIAERREAGAEIDLSALVSGNGNGNAEIEDVGDGESELVASIEDA